MVEIDNTEVCRKRKTIMYKILRRKHRKIKVKKEKQKIKQRNKVGKVNN